MCTASTCFGARVAMHRDRVPPLTMYCPNNQQLIDSNGLLLVTGRGLLRTDWEGGAVLFVPPGERYITSSTWGCIVLLTTFAPTAAFFARSPCFSWQAEREAWAKERAALEASVAYEEG